MIQSLHLYTGHSEATFAGSNSDRGAESGLISSSSFSGVISGKNADLRKIVENPVLRNVTAYWTYGIHRALLPILTMEDFDEPLESNCD